MFRPRVIPMLLLKGQGLVKSKKFTNYQYIGDPINAVKIFNDLKADELVFLDILASKENRAISLDFVRNVGDEANMPFAVGGGIRTLKNIKNILGAGSEKVIINTYAVENPDFIKQASDSFGSSTIIVSIDVKKKLFGKYEIYTHGGTRATGLEPVLFANLIAKNGAGEIIINSINNDGVMLGYDLKIIEQLSKSVNIPVVAAGGAGTLDDFLKAIEVFASAVAAGSMFVYHGARKAVLINYPSQNELNELLIR